MRRFRVWLYSAAVLAALFDLGLGTARRTLKPWSAGRIRALTASVITWVARALRHELRVRQLRDAADLLGLLGVPGPVVRHELSALWHHARPVRRRLVAARVRRPGLRLRGVVLLSAVIVLVSTFAVGSSRGTDNCLAAPVGSTLGVPGPVPLYRLACTASGTGTCARSTAG